jgi:hypothetical protein
MPIRSVRANAFTGRAPRVQKKEKERNMRLNDKTVCLSEDALKVT